MNAADQGALGAVLDQHLVFERPRLEGAKIIGWDPIPGAAVLGRILAATGWRVRPREEPSGRAEPAATLRLVRPDLAP